MDQDNYDYIIINVLNILMDGLFLVIISIDIEISHQFVVEKGPYKVQQGAI